MTSKLRLQGRHHKRHSHLLFSELQNPVQHPPLTDVLDLAHAAPSGMSHAVGHGRSMTRMCGSDPLGAHTVTCHKQHASQRLTQAIYCHMTAMPHSPLHMVTSLSGCELLQ